MRTTKAYLAGLGMTGIVIGSILVLLVVGTGFVSFDGVPAVDEGRDRLERVIVDDGGRAPDERARGLRDRVRGGRGWWPVGRQGGAGGRPPGRVVH
jgi:hypothetical protein